MHCFSSNFHLLIMVPRVPRVSRGSSDFSVFTKTMSLVPTLHTPFQSEMSSTSKKHRDFVGEPMGEKPVTDLAGIGDVLGGRLKEKGFDKAYVVLGQFLVLKKNEELFKDWLHQTCDANKKQQSDCYGCLREWCDAFL